MKEKKPEKKGTEIVRKPIVAIVSYEKPLSSVRKAVDLAHGLDNLPRRARVFIKPNVVFWRGVYPGVLPKWGVITTSRVVEDVVVLLNERGVNEIIIGEGPVFYPKDEEAPTRAFESLGYDVLKKRYGVQYIDVFQRPFETVDLGEGVTLNFNNDFLSSDFVVNIPVLKTHAQTVVSLGIKNLKGMIDMQSRKKCHSVNPEKNLNYMIAKLPDRLPPSLTILDGIYTNEGGPGFDGRIRRSNILVASPDLLSADMVGAKILGYDPAEVPHLLYAAKHQDRPIDLSDVKVVGRKLEDVVCPHKYVAPYNEEGTLPKELEKRGIKGLSYRQCDLTLCTSCFGLNMIIPTAIARAWKGAPWNEVEILTGKVMLPSAGKKKTILIGKCIYQANRDNPDIQEMIAVKGCPPSAKAIVKAFHQAGIEVTAEIFEQRESLPDLFMKRYRNKSEFEESHFVIE
ncbi:MAG: DUF362 domain-containing protein [Proteobacteria bacterium]|nr:DUF362 domain-containing protein [Pseudomonadota bacterium]NIS72649.1 DUF362 domain-containing protein [Pseudomonadota bacterium]